MIHSWSQQDWGQKRKEHKRKNNDIFKNNDKWGEGHQGKIQLPLVFSDNCWYLKNEPKEEGELLWLPE